MPAFDTPKVAIGNPAVFYTTDIVAPGSAPDLTAPTRPLLPGAVEYRYWTVTVSLDGATSQTVTCRLLVSNAALAPGLSVPLARGDLPTWVQVIGGAELEVVRSGILSVA